MKIKSLLQFNDQLTPKKIFYKTVEEIDQNAIVKFLKEAIDLDKSFSGKK